jgi:hypothetical protein
MALDFPSSPTVGQKYPTSPVVGNPQYTWDGAKWTTSGFPISGGGVPVMADGSVPMVAALTLPADPVNPTDAADKHYVDVVAGSGGTGIAPGTVMLFYQASAPISWTKLTTQNDKALRVVSGSGGVAGGTNAFSTVMAQTTVGNHTLTLGETPAGITSAGSGSAVLYFGGSSSNYMAGTGAGGWAGINLSIGSGYIGAYALSGSISNLNYASGSITTTDTSNNTGGGAHNHPITMSIQYIDVILAQKN